MKRTTIIVTAILLLNAIMVKAQDTTNSGIRFEQRLKWNKLLAKAKAEHKYIFVDCYATWCGPCKYMDANTYSVKEVGDVYNKDFISIKVQMDQTAADDSATKKRYDLATMFGEDYHIDAYPTFLFFDSDGKPVHKVTGRMDASAFVQLAADAQNPNKQYYTVLKNFQPGKLDTAEEKSLARTFNYIDHDLGAKIGLDYLTRIPKKQLKLYASGQLMDWYQDNPTIANLAVSYLRSLDKKEFSSQGTLDFMSALSRQEKIKTIAVNYISHLSNKEVSEEKNLNFISQYPDDSTVRQVAKRFITQMPEQQFNDKNIQWYHYLVYTLKEDRYWLQLAQAEMVRVEKIADAPALTLDQQDDINGVCYDVFLHSDDTANTALAIRCMKKVIATDLNAIMTLNALDTYACLLYKSGKTDEALKAEAQVLQICMAYRQKGTYTYMIHTTLAIREMWKDAKIWEEKEFQ
jgi:thioredoxin-related protein